MPQVDLKKSCHYEESPGDDVVNFDKIKPSDEPRVKSDFTHLEGKCHRLHPYFYTAQTTS